MNKKNNLVLTIVFAILFFTTSIFCILMPSESFSVSERRELASFPKLSTSDILDGKFASDFETYASERFPLRDTFRKIKSWFATEILMKKDNNGVFSVEGHISKIDSVENPEMMEYAGKKFLYLYNKYLKGKNTNVYFSIIPDKNYFLAEKNGYPSLRYDEFIKKMQEKTSYMTYIDVLPYLSLSDYYKTDSHWRQEEITDIAECLGEKMGAKVKDNYVVNTLDNDFYGVYYGQLAKSFAPDKIKYLTSDTILGAKVSYFDTGKEENGELYNMKKAFGKDPYEMFLSGTTPICKLINENPKTDKELVIFRDSFASSLAPLMLSGYKTITLVDIRYVKSDFVGNFVDFENKDVLFLYSTTLLNNSLAMN